MARKRRTSYMVTQSDFDTIKKLLQHGLKKSEVARLSDRGETTIKRIEMVDTLEEYQALTRKLNDMYQNKESKPDVIDEPVVYVAEEETAPEEPETNLSFYERIVIAQERQAAALEHLADAWENSPKKRSLF